ncbi:MAG: hypothetical protein HQM10_04240 [Candidatus Riflebacteria bacterium]|nr:hypothetical protein [Candidatus Riflebacteria bacterium]
MLNSKRTGIICCTALLALLISASGLWSASTTASLGQKMSVGDYVYNLMRRLVVIGGKLLEFEEHLIFRLEKRRPINRQKIEAKFTSARYSWWSLGREANALFPLVSASDPKRQEIISLRLERLALMNEHKANLARIKVLDPGLHNMHVRKFNELISDVDEISTDTLYLNLASFGEEY